MDVMIEKFEIGKRYSFVQNTRKDVITYTVVGIGKDGAAFVNVVDKGRNREYSGVLTSVDLQNLYVYEEPPEPVEAFVLLIKGKDGGIGTIARRNIVEVHEAEIYYNVLAVEPVTLKPGEKNYGPE
jgi:hypothetical protein